MEIQVLDESTIDKIAAGEVVDRPSGAVKELVENAMDSGAGAITVEIRDGGISLIRVTDNGTGIDKNQVPRAFLRHATSKIRTAADLQALRSLGFRGEALSSICAVAQVEMITKVKEALTGVRYVIEGGVEKELEEIGAPQGTTVLVRNLFYHVPARKKFLKTSQTEAGYVTDLLEHLALSRPEISFKYMVNGQIRFHTSGNGNLKEVIYRIYGKDIARELLELEAERDGTGLHGLIGTPVIGRASRNFEHCFVNGRFIKSPVIAKAVEAAYKPWLMQHKYPFFVVYLTLDPDKLDINVHPSKMEVRFHEERELADFVFEAVSKTLAGKEMLKEVTFAGEQKQKETMPAKSLHVPEPFETEARKQQDTAAGHGPDGRPDTMSVSVPETPAFQEIRYGANTPDTPRVAEEGVYGRLFGVKNGADKSETGGLHTNIIKKNEHILVEKPVQMNLFEEKLVTKELRDEYQILGQAFDTYWIVAVRDKLLFIDQHAAHEKIKYERLICQIREGNPLSQQINPPLILSLGGKEETALLEYKAYFHRMGFEIESFGGNAYAVRSVPADLYGHSPKELLEDVLDELIGGPVRGEPEGIAEKLASMSCKAAVKGNHAMSREEAESLIDELMTLDHPYHCPHGRPVIIAMSRYELEKKFSRIV